nr:vicilin-like seed storage protein At2g18540 [Osmia lignaria]
MIFNEDDGKDDEYFKRIKEQQEDEMENRRRALIKKCEIKQRLRQHHIKRKEASETEKVQRVQEAVELKVRQIELTERLAKELSRRKHIEQQEAVKCKKKKSTVSSVSDCALEKIHAELIKGRKQDEETQTSQSFNKWCFNEVSKTEQQERKLNYRRELQNQLINNRRRLREKEEEKHRERKILEEVGEAMLKEDLQAEKQKRETATMLQAERTAFLKAREFWKEKRREILKQEHDEISRTIAKKEAQQKREAEGKTNIRTTKEAMVEKLSEKLMEEERKKMEREEICRELYLAEKEAELAREAMKLATNKKRTAKELLQDMAKHQKAVAEKKAKESEIDAAFAKYLAEERRNQNEKKRQEEQARREKNIQYGNELREAITRNRLQRLRDAAQNDGNEDDRKEKNKNMFMWNNNDEDRKIKCHSESVLETLKSQGQKNATPK